MIGKESTGKEVSLIAMERESSYEKQIDDAAVKRYFDGAGGTAPAAMSMMVHEYNLPSSVIGYRLSKELKRSAHGSIRWVNPVELLMSAVAPGRGSKFSPIVTSPSSE